MGSRGVIFPLCLFNRSARARRSERHFTPLPHASNSHSSSFLFRFLLPLSRPPVRLTLDARSREKGGSSLGDRLPQLRSGQNRRALVRRLRLSSAPIDRALARRLSLSLARSTRRLIPSPAPAVDLARETKADPPLSIRLALGDHAKGVVVRPPLARRKRRPKPPFPFLFLPSAYHTAGGPVSSSLSGVVAAPLSSFLDMQAE